MLRLAYLALTNTFALIRLLPMSDRDKDVEILALRHQMAVLQRTHRHRACCRGRCSQGASPTAFMGESSQGDPPDVGRLREVQAEADIEVSGAWRCCHAPLSRQVVATAPVWEAFPEANRVLASRSSASPW